MYGFLVTASKRRHKWDNVIFITWHIFDQCCQLSSLTVHVTTLTEANVILRGSKNSILRPKLHSLPFLQIIYLINALFVTLFITVRWISLFIAVRWISLFIYSMTSGPELMSSASESMCQIRTALPYPSKLAWNLNQSYKYSKETTLQWISQGNNLDPQVVHVTVTCIRILTRYVSSSTSTRIKCYKRSRNCKILALYVQSLIHTSSNCYKIFGQVCLKFNM